jgi:RNA polymerase sigma-70 factor (ECF subfamily)
MGAGNQDLVREATAGNPAAIDALFERHLPGLVAFVRARAGAGLRAREETLDLVQSACREVLKDLPAVDYRSEGGFRHWLYLAAERKILDRAKFHGRDKRNLGRVRPLSDHEALQLGRGYAGVFTPSGELAAREELERVEAALDLLSEEHREVILLARIVGLPHAEVASALGKSEVAVRSLLHRALAKLSIELGPGSSTD